MERTNGGALSVMLLEWKRNEKQFKVEQILNFIKNEKKIEFFDLIFFTRLSSAGLGARVRAPVFFRMAAYRVNGYRNCKQMNEYPMKIHLEFDIYLALAGVYISPFA